MLKKVIVGVLVLVLAFLGYVSTRDGKFRYERSALINAPANKIFPYLSDFHLGGQWNPYEKKDPNMKKTFSGPASGVGAVMEFDGNKEVGSGKLEITKVIPNQSVEMTLTMLSPFKAENPVVYTLTPEGTQTRFTWAMSGDGGFLNKLITLFIDCEKMVAEDFTKGIESLKGLVEAQK